MNQLEKANQIYFNIENFKTKADEERYQEYLNKVLLKYVSDKAEILESVYVNKDEEQTGIITKNGKYIALIPKRKTMYDELLGIHNIALLIGILKRNKFGIESEVIPVFNEYEYIKRYHEKLLTLYRKYLLSCSIDAAKDISNGDDLENMAIIYSDYVLKQRKDDYNINTLNKINAKSLDLKKDLERKKYTI